jgi:scyllo-inositol 2-dehydrogenase (NADP+)
MLRYLIIGIGVQGNKRKSYIKKSNYITVDTNNNADYKTLEEVPLNKYDAALICVPDNEKLSIIEYCIRNKKHILVEKPFPIIKKQKLINLYKTAKKKSVILYVAYNHRFEPHFKKTKKIIDSKILGKIYSCRLFYGNGTALLVKNSPWRDKSLGVVTDLGSHLLDLCNYWFGYEKIKIDKSLLFNFENKSYDHAKILFMKNKTSFELELSLCMWRNHFTCDILAEKGSLHISSLCKWDTAKFILRKRIFPSGKPKEKILKIKSEDPTWREEFNYFKYLIKNRKYLNYNRDLMINDTINQIEKNI